MNTRFGITSLILGSALSAGIAHADPLLFTDAYGVGSPDVIGNVSQFDLHSVEQVSLDRSTPGIAEFNIRVNYNNGSLSLAPFTIGGVTLSAGDLLFKGQTGYWGVALNSTGHGGIVAGALYQATGFLTAQTVLGNPSGVTYRPTEAVWFNPTGAIFQGAGTITTTSLTGPEVNVNVRFVTSNLFLSDIANGYQLLVASATCGNDILRASVPEPAPWLLFLAAGPALAWFVRARNRPALARR